MDETRSADLRPVAIVDISTYRTIYGYERDHFWCCDILRLIIFLYKWRTLTDSVTRYIAKEMQPLNTVEKPAFKNMLQTFFILKNKMFFVL